MVACTGPGPDWRGTFYESAWLEQRHQLADWPMWNLRGRMSMRTEQTTVQSNLFWQREDKNHRVRLSGPWGVGVTELLITPTRTVLITDKGKRYQGTEVEDLAYKHFGWDSIPTGLPYWLIGIPSPSSEPEQLVLDGAGRLSSLVQEGWHVQYLDYVLTDLGSGWRLPRRLKLVKLPVQVTVYVEEWQ